ncbi:MAG: cyclase family protein [Rhodospirillales bacterium]|jgi:arylformamidase|nr:cyclase family protein [Rhodospirillales bacterium]
MSRIIHDVTLTLSSEVPAWPGQKAPKLFRLRSMSEGGANNISQLETFVHFGTHVDAPLHFVNGARPVDQMPLETLIGPCVVVDFPDVDAISREDLQGANIPAGTERLIIRTRNCRLFDDHSQGFDKNFVALMPDAANWVVEQGFLLVGIDYFSIERYEEPGALTHLALLGAEVAVVEGLDLRAISPGDYELICMPLKLKDCDGAPARVALIEN